MLTAAGCQERRQRLWNAVDADVDWLLIGDPRHVCYLSGFWINPYSFSHGERRLLLLRRDGEALLFADNFARRSAVCPPLLVEERLATWYDHQHAVSNREVVLREWFQQEAGRLGLPADRGLLEEDAIPLSYADWTSRREGVALGDVLRSLRRRKLPDEVELLEQCMRAGEAGQRRALEVIAAGMSEFELYCEVESAAVQAAGRPVIVYGDFRATNAAAPKAGGLPTSYRLAQGDLLILDFSVVLQGYRSDFTNTLAVGAPTAAQQDLFAACVAALRSGEAALRGGASGADVYAAASRVLRDAGYGELSHHAGHGLGLAHPEPPILVPHSSDRLLAGDVVTVEPGAYVSGVGGVRVEHNYLVADQGCRRLSHHELTLR